MNSKQIGLFYSNTLALAQAVQLVEGCVKTVLQDQKAFLETLSRNGVEIKITLHPNIGGV